MSAADKIAAARALIEPLTGHTPGPFGLYIAETPSTEDAKAELARLVDGTVGFTGRVVQVATFDGLAIAVTGCGPMGEVNGRIMAAAPALRDTVAALADLADAQAQENEALEAALRGERERIASALDAEADTTPCPEDAAVVRGCARLIRADFSYDAADALADLADAQAQEIDKLRSALERIAAMETPSANATVMRMSGVARAALGETP